MNNVFHPFPEVIDYNRVTVLGDLQSFIQVWFSTYNWQVVNGAGIADKLLTYIFVISI